MCSGATVRMLGGDDARGLGSDGFGSGAAAMMLGGGAGSGGGDVWRR
jgi:hypothetical protein